MIYHPHGIKWDSAPLNWRQTPNERLTMTTLTLKVDGMTCQHCVAHVTEELTALPGVDSVAVTLAEGTSDVLVTTSAEIADAALREAIDEAGNYTVREIIR